MCPLWKQGLPILRSRRDKVRNVRQWGMRQQGIFNLYPPLSYFTVVQLCCLQSAEMLCCSGTSATRRWRGRGRPARRDTRPPAAAGSGSPVLAPPGPWPRQHSRSTQLQWHHRSFVRSSEASMLWTMNSRIKCTQVNFLWIDDVWVTGYLAQHLNIQHQARLHSTTWYFYQWYDVLGHHEVLDDAERPAVAAQDAAEPCHLPPWLHLGPHGQEQVPQHGAAHQSQVGVTRAQWDGTLPHN